MKQSHYSNSLLTSATGIQSAQLLGAALVAVGVMPLTALHYLGTKSSLAMLPSTCYRANSYTFLLLVIPLPSIAHKKRWRQNLASGYDHRVRRTWKEVEDAIISNADLSKWTCPPGYIHFCNKTLFSDRKDGGTQDYPELLQWMQRYPERLANCSHLQCPRWQAEQIQPPCLQRSPLRSMLASARALKKYPEPQTCP